MELLRELICDRNDLKVDGSEESALIAKVVSPVDILLDEGSIQRIVEREQRRKEELMKVKEAAEKKETAEVEDNGDNNMEDTKEEGERDESQEAAKEEVVVKQEENTRSDADDKQKEQEALNNAISARILVSFFCFASQLSLYQNMSTHRRPPQYMIPPRTSRRRGEMPGHCYLALYPPMPRFIQEKMKLIEEEKAIDKLKIQEAKVAEKQAIDKLKVEEAKVAEEKAMENETETESDPEAGTATQPEAVEESDLPEEKGASSEQAPITEPTKKEPRTTITPADRSKALAQARLLLNETVASLSELCNDEAKKDQKYRGVKIEMSPSQKIWKTEERGSRKFGMAAKYESTIEQNDDFKKFVEQGKKTVEELKNRPKPSPGGGHLSETANADDKGSEQIAAIVLHLREKNAAKLRAKKKAGDAEKKKSSKAKVSAKKKTKAEGEKAPRVQKSKRSKKKNASSTQAKGESAKRVAPPPRMLLKKT